MKAHWRRSRSWKRLALVAAENLRTAVAATRRRERRLALEVLEARTVLASAASAMLPELGDLVIDPTSFHASRVLVGLRPGSDMHRLERAPGAAIASARPLIGSLWEFDLERSSSVEAALAALRTDPAVAYAEPDYTLRIAATPNDPQYSSLWGLHNTGQTGGTPDADIDAPEAWDLTTGTSSTIVAVIDTGVDYNHPDLAANIWTNEDEISGDGIDNDGNGYVDDIHGYDFINEDGNPLDDQGHGTHVAGTIGAVGNNGVGVTGINWNVQIMALKFLGADGSGSTSDAIQALNYAVAMGAQLSNNSYGDTQFSQAFRNALEAARQAGHIFVAAAGNNGTNNDGASPFYPASYDAANVIAVAASDHNDRLASFSNFGATTVDLAAPGVDIRSTTPGNAYGTSSGTSMASPHVAGVVGLVRGLHPEWTYQQVIDQVLSSVDFPPALEGVTATGGRLNAARAVGVPDTDGPRIIATSPSGATAGPLSVVRVTFNEPVDPNSFTAADVVSFTGPAGSIAVAGVGTVAGSRDRSFDITFAPQFAKGGYEMVIGPSVFDLAGNPMNQDADGVSGEVPADRYTLTLVIGDTHVLRPDDVPVPLSPFATSTSTLTVNQDLSIADLDVQVDISYPEAGILGLTLISPAGTRVTLATSRDFLGPDYDNTIFDDEAPRSLDEGSPPYSGSFRPLAPLSVLDSTSTLGTWRLEVGAPWFYFGTLHDWSLRVIAHPPRIAVSDLMVVEGDSGDTTATFAVTLSNPIGESVTVDFATADGTAAAGSDYEVASGTLTFAPGEAAKTVNVVVHGDTLIEPDETFFLNLTQVVGASLADSQAVATIQSDEARLSISDVALVEGNSGTAQAAFNVTLSAASTQTITVNYATANGSTAGNDYVPATGVLTFAPGQTSQTINVTVNGDTQNEADETFVVNLFGVANATLDDSQGVGTIRNDDPLPALSVGDAKVTEGNAGTKNLAFFVNLSAASGRPVSVNYATLAGTAAPGSDFTAAGGTLTFSPGQTSKTINIVLAGDSLPEPDETFLLRLSNPIAALLLDSEATGTIQNDDTSLSISDAVLAEEDAGFSPLTFTASLSAAVSFEVRVNYATASGSASAGSDFVSTGGTLVFPPGQTSQTITVLALHDQRDEADETFSVNLTSPTSALLADSQGVATIVDDDPLPSMSIAGASIVEGNSGTKTLAFSVSLAAASGRSVSVQYATANETATAGSDYIAKSGTLTFSPGQVSQAINVTVSGDTAAELAETLVVDLTSPTNATLANDQAVGTILDDDILSISDAVVVEGDSGAVSAVFTVSLALPQATEVSVDYATANGTASAGSDYALVSGTLDLAPGETSRTITVPVIGDGGNEANETFFLNLSQPVGVVLFDAQAVATITDDDPLPGLSVSDPSLAEGNSGTRSLSFTVSLTSASGRSLTVQYATADGTASAGSDYLAKTGTLTFSAGATMQTVNVTLNGDANAEPDETILFNLLTATNATIDDSQGVGTIATDDPLPLLSIGDAKTTEGNAGTKSLNFTVSLSAASTTPVTVEFATLPGTAAAGSDFTAAGGTLTFNPGQTSKSLAVTVAGDALAEADETFQVTLSSPSAAALLDAQATGTIQNDDTSLTIGNASMTEDDTGLATANFLVSLSAAVDFEVRVNYATANGGAAAGTDYVSTAGAVVFAPGQTSQMVSVLILNDVRDESDETFFVNLTSPVNALVADSQGAATIADNDPLPSLSITDQSITEGNSGTKNLNFTIRLSAVSGRTVTVQYATANGTAIAGDDYHAKTGTFSLAAGWTSGTISVPLVGDTAAELDQTFVLTLTSPTNATLAASQATGTILDDDNLSISDAALVEGDSGAVNAVFTLALAIPLSTEVSVGYSTGSGTATAGSDYLATSGTATLAAGQTSQTIIVPVLGDRLDEGDETINLNLANPVNVLLGDTQAVVTIADDDPLPALSIGDVVITEGNSGTKNLSFTVSLSAVSGRTVTVQYATADDSATAGSDYIATSGTLSFSPGWISRTFTVTVSGDALVELDEQLLVNLSAATNATIDDAQGEAILLNDDEEDMSGASAATSSSNRGAAVPAPHAPSHDPDISTLLAAIDFIFGSPRSKRRFAP
jgi:subtilisin family serine protease/subtilisin-like proprotein convertase family protein